MSCKSCKSCITADTISHFRDNGRILSIAARECSIFRRGSGMQVPAIRETAARWPHFAFSLPRFAATAHRGSLVRCSLPAIAKVTAEINLRESREGTRVVFLAGSVFEASRRAAKTRLHGRAEAAHVEVVSLGRAMKYLCPVRQ